MPYTAPAGNAVEFTLRNAVYTAPAGGSLAFLISTVTPALSLAGSLLLGGSVALNAGNRLTANAPLRFSGNVSLAAEQWINGAGLLTFGGSAALHQPIVLQVAGEPMRFGGGAALALGPYLECTAKLSFSGGSAQFKESLTLTVNGRLGSVFGGALAANAGRGLSVSARVSFNGTAFVQRGATLQKASGALTLRGAAHVRSGRRVVVQGRMLIGGSAALNVGRKFSLDGRLSLQGHAVCEFSPLNALSGDGSLGLSGHASIERKINTPVFDESIFAMAKANRVEVFSYV